MLALDVSNSMLAKDLDEKRNRLEVAKLGIIQLLKKLKATPSSKIIDSRIRISNPTKINLLARSYVKYKLNLL